MPRDPYKVITYERFFTSMIAMNYIVTVNLCIRLMTANSDCGGERVLPVICILSDTAYVIVTHLLPAGYEVTNKSSVRALMLTDCILTELLLSISLLDKSHIYGSILEDSTFQISFKVSSLMIMMMTDAYRVKKYKKMDDEEGSKLVIIHFASYFIRLATAVIYIMVLASSDRDTINNLNGVISTGQVSIGGNMFMDESRIYCTLYVPSKRGSCDVDQELLRIGPDRYCIRVMTYCLIGQQGVCLFDGVWFNTTGFLNSTHQMRAPITYTENGCSKIISGQVEKFNNTLIYKSGRCELSES